MFGWLKKKKKENVVPTVSAQGSSDPMSSLALGLNPLIAASIQVDPNAKPKPLSKAKKPRKPKVNKQKVEPRVDVLKFDFDPQNPRLGSIELDWNKEFIELLIKSGYTGNTEDEIVDKLIYIIGDELELIENVEELNTELTLISKKSNYKLDLFSLLFFFS